MNSIQSIKLTQYHQNYRPAFGSSLVIENEAQQLINGDLWRYYQHNNINHEEMGMTSNYEFPKQILDVVDYVKKTTDEAGLKNGTIKLFKGQSSMTPEAGFELNGKFYTLNHKTAGLLPLDMLNSTRKESDPIKIIAKNIFIAVNDLLSISNKTAKNDLLAEYASKFECLLKSI